MKRLLLIPLFCLVLCICIGCNSSSQTKIQARDCQTVEHASGQSCIPRIPQRVVVTDEIALDAVLALDVQPIAAAESTLVRSRARHLANSLDGITSIGRESEPNLERLVELNPDLILGFNSAKTHYRSLSQIAPTVALGYEHTDWKADLEKIGAMLGRGDRAQQQLADYQKRIAEFRAAMGDKLKNTEVSVVRFTAATQNTHYRTVASFPGSVLQDIGLSRPIAQQQPTDQPYGDVSLERMDLLDGDVIFAMLDPRSEESFQQFQNHPLWQTLNAVKTNQVYQVDSGYWSFGNLLAANAILDDLFRYLLPTDQP
jgi:iron complex transport system substrate-binding protein